MPNTRTDIHNRLQNELPFFARHALMIKDKDGKLIPFIFNKAQDYLHTCLEKQLRDVGYVRALVLKGRQEGCSTYVSGRFYHKATRQSGKAVFILSHEAQTTDKLFSMVDRFQKYIPDPLKPSTDLYNRRQIKFDKLESEYCVGTAGNEDVGRGGTLQYFHGSEVASWQKTDGIETGILQSVADVQGSEIILESTAKGMGNMFHRKCMKALAKKGDYILIFIPWFWQLEYRRELNEDFRGLTEEEQKLKIQFNFDDQQVYWRRKKIEELGSLWKFRQEYPNTIQDAFVTSGTQLILADDIVAARKSNIKDGNAPLIMGVDPARVHDRCVIARRRGRELLPMIFVNPSGEGIVRQTTIAARLANIIDNENVAKCFIDTAHGYGVIDILVGLGYGDIVQGVSFQEHSTEEMFLNKRAQMHIQLRDWLHEGGVSIPDSEDVQVDFSAIPDYAETPTGLIKIVAKEKIIEEYGQSPDITDATILTFAYPVRRDVSARIRKYRGTGRVVKKNKNQSPLNTLKRFRRNKKREGIIYTGVLYENERIN